MRTNQEDRPGVSDLPPPEVEKEVKKLAKRKLEDVIDAIPPIENSTYTPMRIDPRDPSVNLPVGMKDRSPIGLFSLFVPQWLLNTIADETNAKAKRYYKGELKPQTRPWHDTTGTEIGAFFGVLLVSGLYKLPRTANYWNTHPDKPILVPIQRTFSLIRWEQIKRFFKIAPHDPTYNSKGDQWYTKLNPWYLHIRKISREVLTPGREVSVDEQLILFKGRSAHTMQIGSKEAGIGFKIYSLCAENYLWDFVFTSPIHGISESTKVPGLTDTGSVVYNLCKQLPGGRNRYIVYTDNFFTNIDLFTALRDIGIGRIGTTKAGSFPVELLALNVPSSKQKSWGLTYMMSSRRMKPPGPDDVYKSGPRKGLPRDNIDRKNRVQEEGPDRVLHVAWQDQSLVQLTTTVHSIAEASNIHEIERVKRSGIKLFNKTDNEKDKINNTIGMCALAHEYNLHMGGSDSNAQVRANYQSKIRAFIWPWSLTV